MRNNEKRIEISGIPVETDDLLVYKNERITIASEETSDLVLFELDLNATYSRDGMYSGV